MPNLTDKILLLLAAGIDEVVDGEKTVTSPYLRIKFASYKSHYYEQTVRKMLKTGEVESVSISRGFPRVLNAGLPYGAAWGLIPHASPA